MIPAYNRYDFCMDGYVYAINKMSKNLLRLVTLTSLPSMSEYRFFRTLTTPSTLKLATEQGRGFVDAAQRASS